MESKVVKAYLLNTPVAGDSVLSGGVVTVTGWFPIIQKNIIFAEKIVAVAETRQVVTIVASANIIASTKYQVAIGNTGNRREGAQSQLQYYGYTSPAVLTGTAATDKHNAYYSLATKINASGSNRARAGAKITIAHDAEVGVYVFGEVIVGGTSGAQGYMVQEAANVLTIAVFSGIFINGEVLTGQTSGATSNSTAGPTLGLGLWIRDDGNYFSSYREGLFQGANTVLATKGFASTDASVTTAAVYSAGQGARLEKDVPVMELLSPNLSKGLFSMATTETVDTALTYTLWVVKDIVNAEAFAGSGLTAGAERVQVLWANDAAAGYAAFAAAMLTNVGA